MKPLALTALILSLSSPASAHLGPDLTQSDIDGLTPVRIAISAPITPTWPIIPIAACPIPKVETVAVACAN